MSLAQASENIGPTLTDITQIADVLLPPTATPSDMNLQVDSTIPPLSSSMLPVPCSTSSSMQVVVIRATMNSFDWTAHHQLYVYRDDPLVVSDYYLYLLDTSKVDNDFMQKVGGKLPIPRSRGMPPRLSVLSSSSSSSYTKGPPEVESDRDPYRERLILTPCPHSSITIFGKGVVRNYGNNFERPISKEDGLTLEVFEKPIFHSDGVVQYGITRFGQIPHPRPVSTRHWAGKADWYGTGQMRDMYRYNDLGITKALLPFQHGDILGSKVQQVGFSVLKARHDKLIQDKAPASRSSRSSSSSSCCS